MASEKLIEKQDKEKKTSYFRNMITNRNAASNRDISATGAMGSITIIVGLLIFIVLIVFYIFNISEANNIILLIDKAIVVLTLGASLLGVRKVSSAIGSKKVDGIELEQILKDLREEKDYYKELVEKEEEKQKKLESHFDLPSEEN